MAQRIVREVLRQLDDRRRGQSAVATDDQLLQRFCVNGDEEAFTILIQRHGPGVLRLCRQLLGHAQDAEDVFQATFLVLASRGQSIRKSPAIGSWLFGVAYRLACKTIAATIRRREVERCAVRGRLTPVESDEISLRDLRIVLDSELARLPESLRAPLLLCYFDGLTQEEAAQQLGWKLRTLKARLYRGRAVLHQRLTQRGITLSAAVLGIALHQDLANASVPLPLLRSTVQGAACFLNKSTLEVGTYVLSSNVLYLARAGLRTVLWTNTKLALLGGLVATIVLLGLGAWSREALASKNVAINVVSERFAAHENVAANQAVDAMQEERVARARKDAVTYLKRVQKDGAWEQPRVPAMGGSYEGGLTSLALLALVRAGVPIEDETIAKGLAYVRKVEPSSTYVVSLQTQVLCLAEPKKDQALVQRNVAWLLERRVRDPQNRFAGWGYPGPIKEPDNSNTHFAVMALASASRAGVKIDDAAWQEIRDYYLRTQHRDGGWSYHNEPSDRTRITMTCAGLCGLHVSSQELKQVSPEVDKAIARGMERLGDSFTVAYGGFRYYNLHSLASLGKLSGKSEFVGKQNPKPRDWFREGSDLLLREQQPDGSWKGENAIDGHPIIATSCGLLFLLANQ